MYSNVVLDVGHHYFEEVLELKKEDLGVTMDTDLKADDWRWVVGEYKKIVEKRTGKPFPQEPREQLWGAIGAVFGSWMNQRAITYRRLHEIPESWGTAVNVQSMVFGNMGEDCATGVAFTRDPSTGANLFYGEYLVNAQGEDVVAGIRTPQHLTVQGKEAQKSDAPSMEEAMPEVFKQLDAVRERLETHYRDMQDIEFTVQRGKLYMLQTRNGKRTAKAALKIAVDMVREGLIDKKEAVARIEPARSTSCCIPTLDPKAAAQGDRQGPAGLAGRRIGQGGVLGRRGREAGARRREGDPGAARDQPRGHPRHARGRGHPDLDRRHDQPRRRGGARHGQALRVGRRRRPHRRQRRHALGARHGGQGGRLHHHRRQHRRDHAGRRADGAARALAATSPS